VDIPRQIKEVIRQTCKSTNKLKT